jgi:hypothetical protein
VATVAWCHVKFSEHYGLSRLINLLWKSRTSETERRIETDFGDWLTPQFPVEDKGIT